MTHAYKVSGMTCSGCQAKVQGLLSNVKDVRNVSIDLGKGEAVIDMEKHVPTSGLKNALRDHPKYQLSEIQNHEPAISPVYREEARSWIETYKPILLVFGYILAVTLSVEWINGEFLWIRWMNHFMAGFFLVFSFFKFLNLQGFAESYSMYDIIAKKWNGWAYLYPFVELGLGLSFLTGFHAIATNATTFIVMTISVIGVMQTVMNKRKIKCACLGAVFNLPMSTITIIEDALMIGMSLIMLAHLV
jgi:copper chaperone CopZ